MIICRYRNVQNPKQGTFWKCNWVKIGEGKHRINQQVCSCEWAQEQARDKVVGCMVERSDYEFMEAF